MYWNLEVVFYYHQKLICRWKPLIFYQTRSPESLAIDWTPIYLFLFWVLKQSNAKVAQGTSFVSSVLCELFTLSFAKKIRNDNGLTTLYVDCWCYNVISFGDSHISLPQPLGMQSFGQEFAGIGGWLYRLCTFDPTVSSPNISRTTTLLQMA